VEVSAGVIASYNAAIQTDANAIAVWIEDHNNYFLHPISGRVVTQYPRTMSQYRSDTLTPDPYVVQRMNARAVGEIS
jgi:hypothetical protein